MNHVWLSVFMVQAALHVQVAVAVTATPSEFKAMEPVCQAIGMGGIDGVFWAEALNKPDRMHILDKPENAMAKGAPWFHHYCWGKLEKFRYFSAKKTEQRTFQLKRWRGEMEFIVNWTSQRQIDWQYIHLIHKEIAESYLYEKNYTRAIAEAERALKQKPDFAAAYALIGDAYLETGNKSKALDYVTEGLKYQPDSRALLNRFKSLGGKTLPAPVAQAASQVPATTTPPAPSDESSAAKTTVQPAGNNHESRTTQPPDNPYCRFCP